MNAHTMLLIMVCISIVFALLFCLQVARSNRRKTNQQALNNRTAIGNHLTRVETVFADKEAAKPFGNALKELRRDFNAIAARIDSDPKSAWKEASSLNSFLDQVVLFAEKIEARLSACIDSEEHSAQNLIGLAAKIKVLRTSSLSFESELNLRLAEAFCENARLIIGHEPTDWLTLASMITEGNTYCAKVKPIVIAPQTEPAT